MFNTSFHQVVSAAQDGTVTVWDPLSGIRTFQFQQTHGVVFHLIVAITDSSNICLLVEFGTNIGVF
jgi:hypothetical protein